jgi:hypothetical protein
MFDYDGSNDCDSGDSTPDDGIPFSDRQMEWMQTLSAAKIAQLKMEERSRALLRRGSSPPYAAPRKSNNWVFLGILGFIGLSLGIAVLITSIFPDNSGYYPEPTTQSAGIALGSLRETSTGLDWNKASYEDKKALCQFLKENHPEINCNWEDYVRILQDYYSGREESKVNKTIQAALEANSAAIRSAVSANEEKYRFRIY